MNRAMYEHPTTQASIEKLKSWGIKILQPESGALACGEEGIGRLASPETILKEVENAMSGENTAGKSVLVTFGGTEEPIDEVRTLANFSRGQTGAMIVDHLVKKGHRVTAIASEKAIKSKKHTELYTFQSFFDLNSLLKKKLNDHHYDAIVHLAAVSDFSVESVEVNGINKEKCRRKVEFFGSDLHSSEAKL